MADQERPGDDGRTERTLAALRAVLEPLPGLAAEPTTTARRPRRTRPVPPPPRWGPWLVAAAALVIVGAMMLSQIAHIDLGDFRVLLPVFLTATVMPLTYSIANGIGAGFISWVLVNALSGRVKQISPLLWVVAGGFVIFFARGPLEALLGV